MELEVYNLSEIRNDKIAVGRAIFVWLKNGFGKCLLFALSAKENPSMEKALFDWSIVLQYDVKVKYWLI